jgi:20S proteasome alpha/beta subunit
MTVVVGLKLQNDIVLGADREESDTYLRHQVQKVKRFAFRSKMIAGLTGDGDAHFIDYSIEKIAGYLQGHPRLTLGHVDGAIETVLNKIYLDHVFPSNAPPDFGLLVACTQGGQSRLFKTQQAAPLEIYDFAASGRGASYATILLEKLWGTLTPQSAVLLCVHVIQETKKHVSTVGGGTDIVILKANGKSATLTSALIKPLEEKLENLNRAFDGAFFSVLWGGNWAQDANQFRDTAGKIRTELQAELDHIFSNFTL